MKVIPAILTDKFEDFSSMIEKAGSYTNYVQIDIMDGIFVPSKSITSEDLARIETQVHAEMHLMIQDPEKTIKDYLFPYVKQVLFHIESTNEVEKVLSILENAGVKKGLAINPDTETCTLEPYLNEVETILFMTVYPGYYGRPMVPHVLEKAKTFKEKYPHLNIGMDGGIKENNLDIIKDTGVDFACVGSAIAMASDPKKAYQRMVKKVR